jgi:lipopolysaccharide/colanic/teichoic acid biosynthesis glycosyltransferase
MNNREAFIPRSYVGAGSSFDLPITGGDDTRGQRDRGLWLLRGIAMGTEGWSRVTAASIDCFVLPKSFPLFYVSAKRAGDIVATVVLLILLAPVLFLLAVLVRLESPGPAFFRQRRVGRNGREFTLWKFRSMHVDAPRYSPSPTNDIDRRVTRFGRLIRRASLDELPQLFNVLNGDMSLVGPRPEMPFIVAGYTPLERRRLEVKPGLTGLWQVSPARAFPIHKNLQYDLHYIQHQNLVLDGAILLRTIVAVIRGVGAV